MCSQQENDNQIKQLLILGLPYGPTILWCRENVVALLWHGVEMEYINERWRWHSICAGISDFHRITVHFQTTSQVSLEVLFLCRGLFLRRRTPDSQFPLSELSIYKRQEIKPLNQSMHFHFHFEAEHAMMNNHKQHLIGAIPLIPIEWSDGYHQFQLHSVPNRQHQRQHSDYNYIQLVREDGFLHINLKWKIKVMETVKFQSIIIITNFLHSSPYNNLWNVSFHNSVQWHHIMYIREPICSFLCHHHILPISDIPFTKFRS